VSRQERAAKRLRRDLAKAGGIDAAYTRIKCPECGTKGRRYEDGSKEIKHDRECSRVRNAEGERVTPPKKAKVPAPRAAAKAAQKPAKPRTKPSAETATPKPAKSGMGDLAAECKRLRDGEGMAWWKIGHTLGLPGSADNVKQGKGGAAQARRLYAQANGGTPHVPRTRTAREKADKTPRHAANAGTKTDRKITLVERGHVIPQDMPDEEVIAMLAGRVIEWGINVSALCGSDDNEEWLNQESRVHPVDVVMEEELSRDGSRVVRFREYLGIDSDTGRHMGGHTKTVRVDRIHTVR
jgi:hypothetical protein